MLRFAAMGWIQELYIDPAFLFPYFGFEFLPRPNALGIWVLFWLCGLSSVGILLGLFYRWSALLFFLSFSYIELLDKANYLNHYYFISLVALCLIFLPAQHAFSLDLKLKRVQGYGRTPRWTILLPQVLIGGLYVMAGLAKLNSDWMLEAMPMRIWLPAHSALPFIGDFMDKVWVAYVFSWVAALYDLSIPFFLFYHRTRLLAYASVILFHGLTAIFFPIGMFPYVMMACSLVFFSAPFLERILTFGGRWSLVLEEVKSRTYTFSRLMKLSIAPVIVLVLVLLFLFPMRFLAYPGKLFWNEQGYRFSWRVMLMEKAGHSFFYVRDPQQKGEIEIDNSRFLTPNQEKQMNTQADMMLQYAHHLDSYYREQGILDPIVRVESWVSLNGEGSRLFIDPFVDLSALEDGWEIKSWIIPFDSVVTVQDLKALKRMKAMNP